MTRTQLNYKQTGAAVNVLDYMTPAQKADVLAGTALVDVTDAIKAAIEYAISIDSAVHAPSGVYSCRPNGLRLDFSGSSGVFRLFGAGASTVFKMGDGLVEATFLFFFDLRPSIDMDVIELNDFMVDNNARGSTPPLSPFDYEQSHSIRFAAEPGTRTKLLKYNGVIVKDPVADGMNNQGEGDITRWVINDCHEIDRTRSRSSIQCSGLPDNLIVTGFTGASIEAEVIASLAPTIETQIQLSNCNLDRLDISGGSAAGREFVRLTANNVTAYDSSSIANCVYSIDNCDLRLSSTGQWSQNGVGCTASDTKLRMQYDESTGAVTSFYPFASGAFDQELLFTDCKFLIDYEGALPVAATGYAINDQLAFSDADAALYRRERRFVRCEFDSRLESTAECYRNGYWEFIACKFASAVGSHAIDWRSSNGFKIDVVIDGGDYTEVKGDFLSSTFTASDHGQRLKLTGHCIGEGATRLATTSQQPANAFGVFSTRVIETTLSPTDGLLGDVINDSQKLFGEGQQYTCVTPHASGSAAYQMSKQMGVKRDTTANRPVTDSRDVGLMYLDTTLDADGKPIWYNGFAWVDALGVAT